MRGILAAVAVLVLLTTTLHAQAPAQNPAVDKAKDDLCRVSGLVTKLADGAPLKGVTIRLENGEDREHTIAVKTGPDGRFALQNVPAGRYKLLVSRNGYVTLEYGQRKLGEPGALFSLLSGQNRSDLIFRMVPHAVITGKVFDEDGEPLQSAFVIALKQVYKDGKHVLEAQATAQTDDLGQYRLFGLAPGKYFVSAVGSKWNEIYGDREFSSKKESVAERGYAKTYFPGTTDLGRASVLSLKAGEEVPSTDISLKQISVYRIRGRVFNQITHRPATEVNIELLPKSKNFFWDSVNSLMVQKADGSFEFHEIAPGSYVLTTFWFDQNKPYAARQDIEVNNADVEGVLLTIGPGSSVPGRLVWEGKPSLERQEITIGAESADAGYFFGASARVEENGQFTLKDMPEGVFRAAVTGISKDCYVKEMQFAGKEVPDDLLPVAKEGGGQLEITISSRGARIQGDVTDADGLPAAGVWVVAVPETARRSSRRWYKSQTTDQYGHFDLHGLGPGAYELYSWIDVETNSWEDSEFLKPFEAKRVGTAITVKDDDTQSVKLQVIAVKTGDASQD